MQTAIAKWVEQEVLLTKGKIVTEDPMMHENRFIWQGAEDIPHAEVHGMIIERCRITQVTELIRWENYHALAAEQRVPGLVRKDREGLVAEAAYKTPPGPIFDSIMEHYNEWGLVELDPLRGFNSQQVGILNIDQVFFPEEKDPVRVPKLDKTPRTYREMRARIAEVVEKVQKGNHPTPKSHWSIYEQCAEKMLLSLDVSERNDNQLIDQSEVELELGKLNDQYKKRYDNRDYRALTRLERTRKDHQTQHLAANQQRLIEVLATRSGDAVLTPEIIKETIKEAVIAISQMQRQESGPSKK